MVKSRIFLYFFLAFGGGIGLSSFIFIPQLIWLGILILGIFLISVFWQYKKLAVAGFCFLFLSAGIWRHQLAESKIIYPEEGSISFTGIVAKEPDIRSTNIKLTIESKDISGRVLATVNRYPEYNYGDELKITGKLSAPVEFEDFNYRNYLAKDGIYSAIYWPEVKIINKNQGNFIYAKVLSFKNKLREVIYSSLSPPQSSILGAMILGDKRKIPDELNEKLNIAGLRHITAVSGMHVAILSGILMSIFLALRLGKKAAFYSTVFLIIIFIITTGLQPSAVRAGIMGSLFLLSKYLGRPNASSRTIVFAAVLMLAQNPLLLKLDAGFQLSFLAMLGIIYLLPTLKIWFRSEVLAMTLSAQIFTLPILIYNFGYVSLVAPVTNILIVPLLSFVMGAGFTFAFGGLLWQPLGWIFSLPVWVLLSYIIKIVDLFNKFPFAHLTLKNLHWIWLIFSYLILVWFAWQLSKKRKEMV